MIKILYIIYKQYILVIHHNNKIIIIIIIFIVVLRILALHVRLLTAIACLSVGFQRLF